MAVSSADGYEKLAQAEDKNYGAVETKVDQTDSVKKVSL